MAEIWFYIFVGFAAQLVDGALGMAYGLIATSLLLGMGVTPATASATVHTSEVFTTGFSAFWHHYFGNIDKALFRRLLLPGMIGAGIGAYLLASISGDLLKPFIAVYLIVLGAVVVIKAFREFPPIAVTKHVAPLGFSGALVDAIGGGGWGPIVASTLLARGSHARLTVGTVNAVEFFVTLTASLVFIATLGMMQWKIILGLALGGMLAAPIGAYIVKKIPIRPLMFFVGFLIMGLSGLTLFKTIAPRL
ncbi:MAG: sulfite exporter TauE/SafE family protein [Burkholderiales bacterium]|nr:sulfite exporter TauE/SafE family protein [Burkholderiales bacterium]